jgi:hypothetical protein
VTTTTSRPSSIRTLVIALGLLLAGLLSASPAMASNLIPNADDGGSGGGGGQSSLVAPYAGSANQRSVQLTESREVTTVVALNEAPAASVPGPTAF